MRKGFDVAEVEFDGRTLLLLEPEDGQLGALTTKDEFERGVVGYAVILATGDVYRLYKRVGHIRDARPTGRTVRVYPTFLGILNLLLNDGKEPH